MKKKDAPASQQTRSDQALAQQLCLTIERDLELAEVHGIHFYVRNNTVTLYGTIRHELDRDLLASLVRQIPGVQAVVEHLQIVDSSFQETDADLVLRL